MTHREHTGNAPGPSTEWREIIEPGEQEVFKDFVDRVLAAQQNEAAQQTGGPLLRAFHAKLHAGLVGEFQVLPDLPAYARFGVFCEPRTFQAVVRFSNGKPSPQPDKGHEPRGIAIKLFGVQADRLPPRKNNETTQDFLATSHSVTSTVRNARQFIAFIEAQRHGARFPLELARAVGLWESLRILLALTRTVLLSDVRSVATEQYSGTAPVKYGPYAVKFTVRPAEGTEPAADRPQKENPNFLRDELANRLRKADILFEFLVQFYVDDKRTPIEDTSVRWRPEAAPFVKVAQLRILSCDLNDPHTNAVSEQVNQLAFSPWHTTEDHRPLGNVMRARKLAYEASAALRKSLPEPTGLPL